MFARNGRIISRYAAGDVYDLFEGHTYYVHQTLHNAFAYNEPDVEISEELIDDTVSDILQDKEHSFLTQLSLLNYSQKETLIAIAKDVKASEVTSVSFVKRHSLQSPSSVQNAIRHLLRLQMITYYVQGRTKVYSVSDRFLQMWIARKY